MEPDAPAQCSTTEPTPPWDSLPEDLPCPRCGYNLRMLTHPRCPECGLDFAWREVIESAELAAACPHFEYQWRKRPARSFLWTIWQLLRPWKFWRELPLSAPPRFTGLAAFGLTLMVVVQVFSAALQLAAGAASVLTIPVAYRARLTTAAWAKSVIADWFSDRLNWQVQLQSAAVVLVFLGITWFSFSLFWQTGRRYNLVPALRVRLIVLSWALLIVCAQLLYGGQTVARIACFVNGERPPYSFLFSGNLATLVALGAFYLSLGFGLSRHARVERARGMVGLIVVLHLTLFLFICVVSTVQFDSWDNPIAQLLRPLFPDLIPPAQ